MAAAADAWLTDPRDVEVYRRLVDAVEARRAYLNPPLAEAREPEPTTPAENDELLDELGDTPPGIAPVADSLQGDPTAVLTRLRRGKPDQPSEHT